MTEDKKIKDEKVEEFRRDIETLMEKKKSLVAERKAIRPKLVENAKLLAEVRKAFGDYNTKVAYQKAQANIERSQKVIDSIEKKEIE